MDLRRKTRVWTRCVRTFLADWWMTLACAIMIVITATMPLWHTPRHPSGSLLSPRPTTVVPPTPKNLALGAAETFGRTDLEIIWDLIEYDQAIRTQK